jgi:hypothetical protein
MKHCVRISEAFEPSQSTFALFFDAGCMTRHVESRAASLSEWGKPTEDIPHGSKSHEAASE